MSRHHNGSIRVKGQVPGRKVFMLNMGVNSVFSGTCLFLPLPHA